MLVKDTDLLVLAKSEILVVNAMILAMSLPSFQYHEKIHLSFTLLHACIKRVLA